MASISPAELRGMLRADAVGLVLGVVLMLAALVTLGLIGLLRRRAAPVFWLGAFSLLYGFRLLERTAFFQFAFDLPAMLWNRVDAAITYSVPIPIVLFARAMFPAWRRGWTAGVIGLTAFAIYGVISDAVVGQPHSAIAASNVIAIAFFAALLGWISRPGLAPSHDLQTMRIGAAVVSVAALADNLRGIGVVTFRGPDLEPFGFTVLVVCLGAAAISRLAADSRHLVAIRRELDIARQIQASILPQSMPRVKGLTVAARYRPMNAVAGDFYDFLEMDAHRLGILVADVSGHGVPAALIASMVKVALAAQRDRGDSPAAVLAGMNDTLCGRLAGQYVTAAYLFIDTASRVIRYGAAGHPPILRVTPAGIVEEVEQNGLILGFAEYQRYGELEDRLRTADRFVLYTDGLIEAFDSRDDIFGIERLKMRVGTEAGRQADAAAEALLTAVESWSGRPAGDDRTLVLVDWSDQQ